MRIAGAAASALGHAALIALAVWALPWLRVRPKPPDPPVAVSLVREADLAELVRRAAARPPPPPPAPAAAAKAPPAVLAPRFLPPETPEPPEPPPPAPGDLGLAPAFDPASPLGFATTPPPAAPPAEAAGPAAEPEAPPYLGILRERHLRALARAVLRARAYPAAAKGRGLMGTAVLYIEADRDGRLVEVRLVGSSGSATLDRAAVEAARSAQLPAAPEELPGASFAFTQGIAFEAR